MDTTGNMEEPLPAKAFPFLRLPRQLRDKIYEDYVMVTGLRFKIDRDIDTDGKKPIPRLDIPIAVLNKTVHGEVMPMLRRLFSGGLLGCSFKFIGKKLQLDDYIAAAVPADRINRIAVSMDLERQDMSCAYKNIKCLMKLMVQLPKLERVTVKLKSRCSADDEDWGYFQEWFWELLEDHVRGQDEVLEMGLGPAFTTLNNLEVVQLSAGKDCKEHWLVEVNTHGQRALARGKVQDGRIVARNASDDDDGYYDRRTAWRNDVGQGHRENPWEEGEGPLWEMAGGSQE